MSDFEAPPTAAQMTAAERAVDYILHRVVHDRDFSHVMLGTQALRLCLLAQAARTGQSDRVIEQRLGERMEREQPRLEQDGCGTPQLVELRRKIEALHEAISNLYWSSKIDHDTREMMSGLLR